MSNNCLEEGKFENGLTKFFAKVEEIVEIEDLTMRYCNRRVKKTKVLQLLVGDSQLDLIELIWVLVILDMTRKNNIFKIRDFKQCPIESRLMWLQRIGEKQCKTPEISVGVLFLIKLRAEKFHKTYMKNSVPAFRY